MDSTLVSQSTVQSVQFALNEVAGNLVAHANATLSKAHGINLIKFAANSIQDSNGNDISVYYDDHGDVIGSNFVQFTLSDAVYYAPANDSALGGQPALTPQGLEQPVVVTAPTPKQTSWITDIITPEVATVDSINNQILLAHSLLGYWETHGTMFVFAKTCIDSLGHVVGDHVVQFQFNGGVYQIPCTTRLGGMPQPPYSLTLAQNPTKGFTATSDGSYQHYENRTADIVFGQIYPNGLSWTPNAGGTKPITYTWWYYPASYTTNNPAVPDLNDPTWIQFPASGVNYTVATRTKMSFVINATSGIFTLTNTSTPNDFSLLTTWIKVVATNPIGSTAVLLRFVTAE